MNSTQSEPQRIPFNLERALAGDPVVRRDGTEVAQVLKFKGGNLRKSVVTLSENGGFFLHHDDGTIWDEGFPDMRDLFMTPKTKTVWVNLYKVRNGLIYTGGEAHNSQVDAEVWKDTKGYVKTISVEVPV